MARQAYEGSHVFQSLQSDNNELLKAVEMVRYRSHMRKSSNMQNNNLKRSRGIGAYRTNPSCKPRHANNRQPCSVATLLMYQDICVGTCCRARRRLPRRCVCLLTMPTTLCWSTAYMARTGLASLSCSSCSSAAWNQRCDHPFPCRVLLLPPQPTCPTSSPAWGTQPWHRTILVFVHSPLLACLLSYHKLASVLTTSVGAFTCAMHNLAAVCDMQNLSCSILCYPQFRCLQLASALSHMFGLVACQDMMTILVFWVHGISLTTFNVQMGYDSVCSSA